MAESKGKAVLTIGNEGPASVLYLHDEGPKAFSEQPNFEIIEAMCLTDVLVDFKSKTKKSRARLASGRPPEKTTSPVNVPVSDELCLSPSADFLSDMAVVVKRPRRES